MFSLRLSGRNINRVLAMLLLLSFILVSIGCVSSSKYETALQENEALKQDRDKLASNLKSLESKLASLEEQKQQLEADLENTNNQLTDTNKQLDEKNQELADTNKKVEDINAKLASKNQELESTNADLLAKQQELANTTQKLQATADYVQKTNKLYDDLVNQLSTELEAKQIKIQEIKDGVTVNLSQDILFSSGSAKLNKSGREVITKVSEKLKDIPHQIIVAGFTDNVPIRGSLLKVYPTNWELAGARAASVVRLLEKQGLDSSKLTAVSFGENQPVESNETADGKKQNRRIEIRLRAQE